MLVWLHMYGFVNNYRDTENQTSDNYNGLFFCGQLLHANTHKTGFISRVTLNLRT